MNAMEIKLTIAEAEKMLAEHFPQGATVSIQAQAIYEAPKKKSECVPIYPTVLIDSLVKDLRSVTERNHLNTKVIKWFEFFNLSVSRKEANKFVNKIKNWMKHEEENTFP